MSSSEDLFDCAVCYELAYPNSHACTNESCCKLVCGPCAAKLKEKCPNCGKADSIKASPVTLKTISRMKVLCPK